MLKPLLINFLDKTGILSISRYLHRRQPIILMYHRIIDHPLLPGIPPAVFEEQMHYLKKHSRIVSIDQLVNEINSNAVKPNTVAITFDDGHRDFYSNAWPILKSQKIPASLYITTNFIDQKHMLWPDLLRYLIINSTHNGITLETFGRLSLASDEDKLLTWNTLGNYCLTLGVDQRSAFLKDLATHLNVEWIPEAKEPFLPVNWSEIQEMQTEGLIIGSHTVSHPILSKIGAPELQKELQSSHRIIYEKCGSPPAGVCYPNGMAADMSPEVIRQSALVYRYGLVAFPAKISKENIMQLGRKAAPKTLWRFKQILSNMSFRENISGNYQ